MASKLGQWVVLPMEGLSAHLLAKYQDVKIYFVSPDVIKMKVNVDPIVIWIYL